jgi:type II secretory pathway pseudopilin PulG
MSRGERGSALVEALVSAAIVAAALAAALQVTSQSGQRRVAIGQKRAALMIARSELATVGSAIPAAPGETTGADGAYSWRVRAEPGEGGSSRLLLVTVSVRQTGGTADLAVLKSMRLAGTP